jgi:DNA processing protein
VTVSPFWPGTPVSDRTIEVSHLVTSALAAAVYVTGLGGGERAAMALSQGKHVFARADQPWAARLAYRGGVTVVAGIDDLVRQAVNLVDVTRLPTLF